MNYLHTLGYALITVAVVVVYAVFLVLCAISIAESKSVKIQNETKVFIVALFIEVILSMVVGGLFLVNI